MNPRLEKPRVERTGELDAPDWLPQPDAKRSHEWIEAPAGDSWVAAFRVVIRDGRPVIAELRVFPAEAAPSGHWFPPGTWSGTWNPDAPIPGSGITAGLLKQKVRLSVAFDHVKELQEQMKRYAVNYWKARGVGAQSRSGRGRKAKPARFYAEVARDYARIVEGGSRRPAADVAAARGISPALVRAWVKRARGMGFLDAVPTGQMGGQLTDEGKRALRGATKKSK